jgi:hypothetical protein
MKDKKSEADYLYFKKLEITAQNLLHELPQPDSVFHNQLLMKGLFPVGFRDWEIQALIHHLCRMIEVARKCADSHDQSKPNSL